MNKLVYCKRRTIRGKTSNNKVLPKTGPNIYSFASMERTKQPRRRRVTITIPAGLDAVQRAALLADLNRTIRKVEQVAAEFQT